MEMEVFGIYAAPPLRYPGSVKVAECVPCWEWKGEKGGWVLKREAKGRERGGEEGSWTALKYI